MKHYTSPDFWEYFEVLPESVRNLAKRNFKHRKHDPGHLSLHLKKVGSYWSVRIGLHYRSLGKPVEDDVLWGWIGSHEEYNRLV